MKFDIVCTATLRPELLFKTLQSFNYNLFNSEIGNYRFTVNIDLTGVHSKEDIKPKLSEVLSVINGFNFKEVILRWTDKPNFATAWFWIMGYLQEPLVFYLEEDWLLLREVDLDEMLLYFREDLKLVHLRLSAFNAGDRTCKNWNKFTYWNGKYFNIKGNDKFAIGWSGHPGFTRVDFLRKAMAAMNFTSNPEKQIKGRRYPCQMNKLLLEHNLGVYIKPCEHAQIKDLGRNWMIENGFKKSGNKAFFTTWEKTDDN